MLFLAGRDAHRLVACDNYRCLVDPLTAAVCSLKEIESMFNEMWEAERASLSAFE